MKKQKIMKMDFKPSNGFHAEDYKKRKIFPKILKLNIANLIYVLDELML